MKILSIFDGVSCARVALDRAGIPVEEYYASEIDPYAIQISRKNWPDIIQIGDVKTIPHAKYENGIGIDLLIGGFPCVDLSIAKRERKGLAGEKSGLFYEMIRIHKEVKPKWFVYENVASMGSDQKELILKTIQEIDPTAYVININAALVSAQQRKRLFFTNIPNVTQPEDRGIILKDILIDGIETKEKSLCVTATYSRACPRDYFEKSSRQLIKVGHFNKGGQGDRVYSVNGKSVTLSALGGGRGAKTGLYETTQGIYRKLHPVEVERLMGLEDGYTEGVSATQRYKMLGNGFHVDVIAHILSFIPKK